METLLQILLTGVKDLETCVQNAKMVILESYEDDAVVERLNFYDEALKKIESEVGALTVLNANDDSDYYEIDQSIKRIVQLSNMIKQDTVDLLLALETGMDLNIDVDTWN
ncbi:MAG: hypothetical protein ACK5GV_08790 [Bacteroidota bacterium]|jgi:hypothetical protein